MTAEAGVGTGLRASGKSGSVEIGGGYKYDALNIKINSKATSKDIDFGEEEKSGGSFKVGNVTVGAEEGFYHSYLCEFKSDENHTIDTCPNTIQYDGVPTATVELVGIDVYCLVGVSASISFDWEYFWDESVVIWNE